MFYKKNTLLLTFTYNTTAENMLKNVYKTLHDEEPFLIRHSQHSVELFFLSSAAAFCA